MDAYFENGDIKYIALGQENENILLLDKEYKKINVFNQIGVGRISFSKDGKKIIATSSKEAIIWHISFLNLLIDMKKECRGINYNIWAMAYNKEKQLIYTAGSNGKIYIWDENCELLNLAL